MYPTSEYLNSVLNYCPDTGLFTWKARVANRVRIGDQAGSLRDGYIYIAIKNVQYGAHRLAWLMLYNARPRQIDHINGIKHDNRLCNLREVTQSENLKNKAKSRTNTTGCSGVHFVGWKASINVNGKRKHLGSFQTLEEAVAARKAAEVLHGYHPNHGR
jgi:hypothetical protein